MKFALLLSSCLLLAVCNAASKESAQHTYGIDYVLMPDNHGKPTMALLHGTEKHPKAVNLPKEVLFYLYTSQNTVIPQQLHLDDTAALQASNFNKALETKVLIHGYTNDLNSDAIQDLKNAYVAVGNYNILAVDWGSLCSGPLYNIAKGHVVAVGEYVGLFLDFLVNDGGAKYKDIHMSGHSLGAHVCGIAGSNSAGTVGRITGMDPALPLFDNDANSDRLDASDASYVDVIHTCGGLLGFLDPLGDSDFYPNGGTSSQPGCGLVDLTGSCSHSKSHEWMAASISDPTGYPSYACATLADAEKGSCAAVSTGQMGEGSVSSMKGFYHLVIHK